MDRLYEICEKYDLTVIEDCAHAMGVTWRGKQLGNRAKVSFVDFKFFVLRTIPGCALSAVSRHVRASSPLYFRRVSSEHLLCVYVRV